MRHFSFTLLKLTKICVVYDNDADDDDDDDGGVRYTVKFHNQG